MIGSLVAKKKLESAFRLLGEKNLTKFMADWSEDSVFHYPGQLSVSGTFQGKENIRRWFQNTMNHFEIIDFQLNHVCVENIFDVAGTNNLIAQWTVNLTNKDGVKVTNVGANLVRIKSRRIVEVRDFFFYQEKLAIGWGEQSKDVSEAVLG